MLAPDQVQALGKAHRRVFGAHIESPDHAAAAQVLEARVVRQGAQRRIEHRRHARVVAQHIALLKAIEHRQRGAASQRVAAVGVRVQEAACHVVAQKGAVDGVAAQYHRQWQEAAGDALREAQQIGPDLLCLSKGITGGFLPLSVVLCRDAIYRAFLSDDVARGFLHSHSYSGNALACRAALAVLDRFEQRDVLGDNARVAAVLDAALSTLAHDPRLEHLRCCGMIWAFDVRAEHAPVRFAERLHLVGRQHELLLRPIGRTVYLMPPYVLDEALARWLGARLIDTLNETLNPALAAGLGATLPPDADRTPEPSVA